MYAFSACFVGVVRWRRPSPCSLPNSIGGHRDQRQFISRCTFPSTHSQSREDCDKVLIVSWIYHPQPHSVHLLLLVSGAGIASINSASSLLTIGNTGALSLARRIITSSHTHTAHLHYNTSREDYRQERRALQCFPCTQTRPYSLFSRHTHPHHRTCTPSPIFPSITKTPLCLLSSFSAAPPRYLAPPSRANSRTGWWNGGGEQAGGW